MSRKVQVYKIINGKDDKIYVGSTMQGLQQRYWKHKHDKDVRVNQLLYKHMEEIGIEFFSIVLLEEKTVDGRRSQFELEQEWMDRLKPELNKLRAFNTKEKEMELARERRTKNYHIDVEESRRKDKEWREKNPELRQQIRKKSYLKHQNSSNAYCDACDLQLSHRDNFIRHCKTTPHWKALFPVDLVM